MNDSVAEVMKKIKDLESKIKSSDKTVACIYVSVLYVCPDSHV